MGRSVRIAELTILAAVLFASCLVSHTLALTKQSGAVGVQGEVKGPPPSPPPTIDVPRNGESFSNIPITVSGFCASSTTVEIYKNNVFAGATPCSGNSYRLQIDLFDGRNDLIAREYDDLNQYGQDSATVTVNFNSPAPTIGPRVTLTSEYSKRGANPGSILNWPVSLSGGSGPYAISVDWGDKTKTDLVSQPAAGTLNLQHTYAQSGVYNILIRATDVNGNAAFLQLVGIGNGPIQKTGSNSSGILTKETTKIIWWPIVVLFLLMIAAFFVGQRQQLEAIRRRLRQEETMM